MAIYIAPIGSGFGDVVVSFPILQGLIANGEKVHLVARSPRQEGFLKVIPGLFGSIREPDLKTQSLSPADRYFNFREHSIQMDWVWGSAEFEQYMPKARINGILEKICSDFGIPTDFSELTPLPYHTDSRSKGRVLFVPGTTGNNKEWSVENWLQLENRLREIGFDISIVGEPERSALVSELIQLGLDWISTPTVAQVIDTISSAKLVVSVDTGVMHLAVNQGIPTIALFNNPPIYERSYDNCFSLVANACQAECLIDPSVDKPNIKTEYVKWQWLDGERGVCKAAPEKHCMRTITVEMVMDIVLRQNLLERTTKARTIPTT